MSNFSSFERAVAGALRGFPKLKGFIKVFYSRVAYLFFRTKESCWVAGELSSVSFEGESFFGYYDKCPTNKDGLLLCHLTDMDTRFAPVEGESIEVALFDCSFSRKIWSARTLAFNWQQGSRLQWLDDQFFVYNDVDTVRGRYCSKVVCSRDLKLVKTFSYPVQDSYRQDFFLSINYSRLMKLRPDYGYQNLDNEAPMLPGAPQDDGIFKVQFETGESKLLVSLFDVSEMGGEGLADGAFHKINHVMLAPSGKRFIFLHRVMDSGQRFDRLFLADSNTGALSLISDSGMISHYHWVSEEQVIAYMRGPDQVVGYWLIDVSSGEFQLLDVLAGHGDGHPNCLGDYFVTDTYPDKAQMQHLSLINFRTGSTVPLARVFHGFSYSGVSRCDLHPRFSLCGRFVYFDSVFSGKRKFYRLELSKF